MADVMKRGKDRNMPPAGAGRGRGRGGGGGGGVAGMRRTTVAGDKVAVQDLRSPESKVSRPNNQHPLTTLLLIISLDVCRFFKE